MSERWGLISEVDASTLMKTIDLIAPENTNGVINICEVGIYAGSTGRFLKEYVQSKNLESCITGIDNNKDGEILRFEYDKLIIGNSNEVYNQVPHNSQHLILIDGLHTFPSVVADFFCYAPKVKKGGYIAFHDTGKHIDPLSGWQGVGDKNDPDMCLGGVRKALKYINLIGGYLSFKINLEEISTSLYGVMDLEKYKDSMKSLGWVYEKGRMLYKAPGWELVFDEADPNDNAGGVCVFKKLN